MKTEEYFQSAAEHLQLAALEILDVLKKIIQTNLDDNERNEFKNFFIHAFLDMNRMISNLDKTKAKLKQGATFEELFDSISLLHETISSIPPELSAPNFSNFLEVIKKIKILCDITFEIKGYIAKAYSIGTYTVRTVDPYEVPNNASSRWLGGTDEPIFN